MLRIFGRKNKDFLRDFYYFCKLDLINKRIIKKLLKISWTVIVAIAVVIFAGGLILQFPKVQTFAADKVVKKLSEKLDGDIRFEKIHLKPFTTFVLKNVAIIDRNPAIDPADTTKTPVDTFFRAEYIIARFTLNSLLKGESIGISRAYVSNAQMNLVLEDIYENGEKSTFQNLSRIFRIKKKEKKEKNPNEIFRIKEVEIDNFGFALINHKERKIPRSGMIDWNDMSVSNVCISARDLKFKGGVMSGIVDKGSFKEKSGFNVSNLAGHAIVGNGKTIIKNLKIKDEWSDIAMPLYMMTYENVKAFSEYITDVKMDAEVSESVLNFKTIAYFAKALQGNDLGLTISGFASGTVDDFKFNNIKAVSNKGGFS